jgi:exopolysaccharide production protein ExoZ
LAPTLVSIQALRGLAALSVVAFHASQWIGDRFWIGAAGVDVFFVVSGFIIWRVASTGEARPGVFFWRRLTRVAPAYWLVTGLVAALAVAAPALLPQVSVTPRHLALSLAFIPHFDPAHRLFPLLPPGWTLDYEALFYGLVALTLLAPARMRFAAIIATLMALAFAGFIHPPLYEYGANPMLLEFAAGVWLARAGPPKSPKAALALAAGVAMLAALQLGGWQSDLLRPLLWGVPAVLIVAGALALEPVVARWRSRALLALGDASYAIYLCHYPAVDVTARLFGVRPGWMFVPIAIAVSIVAGLIFHRFIERPLIGAVRGLPARLRGGDSSPTAGQDFDHAVGQP